MESFSGGEIGFDVGKEIVRVNVKGKYGADILVENKGMVEGEPINDSFLLTIEEYMDFMFALYGIEKEFKWNDANKRIEVGNRSGDYYVKFTNFSENRRSIFYLRNIEKDKLLLLLEAVRGQLREVRFRHEEVSVLYDWNELHIISENEGDIIYGYSLELLKEIIRDGFTNEIGFLSFGAGRISLNKNTGSIVIGGKAYKDTSWTDTFYLAEGVSVPKLTAKLYLAVR